MKKRIAVLLLLLILAGCGRQQEALSPVYSDWSKLTPYEPAQTIYTYHPGYSENGALAARDDYGALLPYIGKYSAMDRYVIEALPFYGLVTDKGELVTDPVYSRIDFYDDFLVLYRGDPSGDSGGDAYAGGTFSRTLAAPDGRWAHALTGSYYIGNGHGLLLTAASDGSLDLWNRDGEIVTHFDGAPFTSRFGKGFLWGEEGGPFIDWPDDKVGYVTAYYVDGEEQEQAIRLYLDFTNGTVADTPPAGYPSQMYYTTDADHTPEPPVIQGCNYLQPISDKITGETYFYGLYRDNENDYGRYALFDSQGKLLLENVEPTRYETSIIVRAGLYSSVENGCFCFREIDGNAPVFCYTLRTNSD
ncbi:MAG: hypothetical protein K6B40_04050 [Firmicutes bacterium]|nr:hypothetical protein [Bacillota bacterium]